MTPCDSFAGNTFNIIHTANRKREWGREKKRENSSSPRDFSWDSNTLLWQHSLSFWPSCLWLYNTHLPYRRLLLVTESHFNGAFYFTFTWRSYLQPALCLVEPRWLSRYSDSLRARRSGDRIPVGARFSAPIQTGPGAHLAFCTMGTGSSQG